MTKSALIVDDSAVARRVLSRLLSEYGLYADTAESAEAALEHLKHRRPDVIFMDHLMPGMDGFEALEAIKANPVTATIPVMMYTAQEGELYVSQARALGAFGVLPKDLQPIEVARVLKALRLIPADGEVTTPAAAEPRPPAPDAGRVKELLEELFYQQRAALREEIREGYQHALESTQTQHAIDPEAVPPIDRPALIKVAALVLLSLTFGFAYLYASTNEMLRRSNRALAELVSDSAEPPLIHERSVSAPASTNPVDAGLLEILEGALNLDGQYDFGDVPLDDKRATLVAQLVPYLERTGYSGTIELAVHVGLFCMNYDEAGNTVIAPADQSVGECQQLGVPAVDAAAITPRQSLTFANTVASVTAGTQIRVRTIAVGSDQPVVGYPQFSDFVNAGAWNNAAAQNHRVTLRLIPDAESSLSHNDDN
jgi:CheY-like chemotaxis protein